MKYFRMSWHEVLYERSFLNLILLNRAIPGIKPFKKGDADDPDDSQLDESARLRKTNNFFMGLM